MSESTEEKQFAPTEQKLRKALEEGNVLFVPQLNSGIILIIGIITLTELSKALFIIYERAFDMLMRLASHPISKEEIEATVFSNLTFSFAVILGIIFIFSLISFAISVTQVKGIRFVPLKLKFESFNVIQNAKQKFSKKTLVKLIMELIFIFGIIYIEVKYFISNVSSLINMIYLDIDKQMAFLSELIYKLVMIAIVCFVVYLVLLYAVENDFYIKNLMMSHQEIKQEIENSEGKAEVKGRIRELQQELLEDEDYMDAILSDYGSFVVANPTHYGIVIFYAKDTLPIVMLKGKNQVAKKIFAKARKLGIPVIQSKFIARMLYELTNPGDAIPKSMIGDVGKLVGLNYAEIAPFIKDKSVLTKRR